MLLFEKQTKQKLHHVRYTEFQAIVLCGYGNRLYPLTEDNNVPKALLPIANKPMLYYVLDWLERAGITDVIVISELSGEHKIGHYIKNDYEGKLKPSLEVVKEDVGTADVLRVIKDKIRNDFIVISCDLILDLPPHQFLDLHRTQDHTFTALYYEPNKSEGGGGSGSNYRDDKSKQIVGVDINQSRLVYVASGADLDQEFSLRMSLLWKFPRVNIHTTLQDSHLYIFKRWVIDLIAQKKAISSVREQLVPLLVKCQYQKKLLENEGIDKPIVAKSHVNHQKIALEYSITWDEEDKEPVRCQVYIYKTGFCGRGNTVAKYCDLNRHMTKISTEVRVSPSAEVNAKTQVGSDSLVGDDTKIDERTSIKRSTIGSHCIIGKNVKISNSVLMDNIIVEDNVKLDGCVVCNNAKIMEKSVLKDCEVGGGYVVITETQAKNEQLVEFRDI